jgi:hypothetical protein
MGRGRVNRVFWFRFLGDRGGKYLDLPSPNLCGVAERSRDLGSEDRRVCLHKKDTRSCGSESL